MGSATGVPQRDGVTRALSAWRLALIACFSIAVVSGCGGPAPSRERPQADLAAQAMREYAVALAEGDRERVEVFLGTTITDERLSMLQEEAFGVVPTSTPEILSVAKARLVEQQVSVSSTQDQIVWYETEVRFDSLVPSATADAVFGVDVWLFEGDWLVGGAALIDDGTR